MGIHNPVGEISFNVYPNPAENIISVSIVNPGKNFSYAIYDVSGKLISTGNIHAALTNIQTHHFSNGMYVIRISGENTTGFKKFIVQH